MAQATNVELVIVTIITALICASIYYSTPGHQAYVFVFMTSLLIWASIRESAEKNYA